MSTTLTSPQISPSFTSPFTPSAPTTLSAERARRAIRVVSDEQTGIEVPAAGVWPLLRSSSLRRRRGRHGQLLLRTESGWLEIGDDPQQSWLRIEATGILIDAVNPTVHAHPFDPSEWRWQGRAQLGAVVGPADVTLRYHGVFRRGGDLWAWFTGEAALAAEGRQSARRGHRTRAVIDLDLAFRATAMGNAS